MNRLPRGLALAALVLALQCSSAFSSTSALVQCLSTSFGSFDNINQVLPNCGFRLDVSSTSSVEARCVKPGVVVVTGEYNVLQITCSALYPLQFQFDGITPTEAIEPFFRRVVDERNHTLIKEYIMDVSVYSIEATFLKFHSTDTSAPELEPRRYSRTGEYMFHGYADEEKYGVSFYIYLEEPMAKVELIRNNGMSTKTSVSPAQIWIPCRSTHRSTTVGLEPPQDGAHDKERGFLLGNFRPDANYSCVLRDEQGNRLDELVISPSKPKAERERDRDCQKVVLIAHLIPGTVEGKNASSVECHLHRAHGEPVLYRVPAPNFIMRTLSHEFVYPKFVNRSFQVHRGSMSSIASPLLTTTLTTTNKNDMDFGSAYCGDDRKFGFISYMVMINAHFSYSIQDHTSAVKSKGNFAVLPELEMNLYVNGVNHQKIYEGQLVHFACAIITAVYVPPGAWLYRFRNGSVQLAYVDYNWSWKNGTSHFVTNVPAAVTQVIFQAAVYRFRYYHGVQLNVTVLPPTTPTVQGDPEESVEFAASAMNPTLNCTTESFPLPTIHWLLNGKNITAAHGDITNETLEDESKAVFSLGLKQVIQGDYACVLTNVRGSGRKLYHVRIRSDLAWLYIVATLFISAAAVIGAFLYFRFRADQQIGLTKKELDEFYRGQAATSRDTQAESDYQHHTAAFRPYNKEYELPKARFTLEKRSVLGSGAYGVVMRGILDGKAVAVKTVKQNADKSYIKALLCELKIQIYLGSHPNLVIFLGAHTQDLRKGMVYAFVEFCGNGCLESYLRAEQSRIEVTPGGATEGGTLTRRRLFQWAVQIAAGMEFLSEKKVIHGDLATRNILLDDFLTAKITDFGLSRQLYNYTEYVKKQQEPLPWRWMALESLKNLTFSSKSDIWPYGVTLWEIFSLGQVPYPGQSWNLGFVSEVENGLRLLKPSLAPETTFQRVMLPCWNADPDLRPTFADMKLMLTDYMNQELIR